MKQMKLLPLEDMKNLRVIEIQGNNYYWFLGYFAYLRDITPGYNTDAGDILDEQILKSFQSIYPDSHFRFSNNILFEGELDDNLKRVAGRIQKIITIQFCPILPFASHPDEYLGKEFFAYPKQFQIRVADDSAIQSRQHLQDFYLCHIPHDLIKSLVESIYPI
jgi:hypothetical protein